MHAYNTAHERVRALQLQLEKLDFAHSGCTVTHHSPDTNAESPHALAPDLSDFWCMEGVELPERRITVVDLPCRPFRHRVLEGELARSAMLTRNVRGRILHLITVPTITRNVLNLVLARTAQWMPEDAWMILDERGSAEGRLHDPNSNELRPVLRRNPAPPEVPVPIHRTERGPEAVPWTETNIYLAKWLFLAGTGHLWTMSRPGSERSPANAAELAHLCGVSRATSYRFVDAFVRAGLITSGSGGIDIRDPETFLSEWRNFARQSASATDSIPVQWHGGIVRRGEDVLKLGETLNLSASSHVAPAGFTAADLCGWLTDNQPPIAALHWLNDDTSLGQWLQEHSLFPVSDRRDAHFWMLKTPAPLGISRCMGSHPSAPLANRALQVADPLQMIVDCCGLPRGDVQVEYLIEQLLISRTSTRRWP